MKKKSNIVIIIVLIVSIIAGLLVLINRNKHNDKANSEDAEVKIDVSLNNEFNMDILKIVNSKENGNYLISPYSIEIALNMLKEGAQKETYNQINKVISNRKINYFNIKDRISVANAIFIKDEEKDNISNNYINKLQTSYRADLIFDKFSTPDVINNWVNEKTYKMIPKILDSIPKDFVLGLANAVAINVEWEKQFDCGNTKAVYFKTPNGDKKVEMMNNTYNNAKYILSDNEEGIILPYMSYTSNGDKDYDNKSDSTKLEFIAIMPKNTPIRNYINNLILESLNNIININKELNEHQELSLEIPRFEYDFNDTHFIDDLKDLGIKDVFDPDLSNLGNMKSTKTQDDFYVSDAIHMTHISLNEKGTKASAVTYFGINKTTAFEGAKEKIAIKFNKPFMYMIRDTKSKEILFFGVVQNPNEWNGNTCS